jgi:hypothetical protein
MLQSRLLQENPGVYGGTAYTPLSSTTSWQIGYGLLNGASSVISRDGGSESTGNSGAGFDVRQYVIGSHGSGNPSAPINQLDGDIGEVFIFNKTLTSGEKASLLSYLGTKWGIAI